jgi:hypothetical protein
MPDNGPSIVTFLGLQVPLLNPKAHDIQLRDIAHHLATINRFSGAAQLPLSVAQHSCLVAEILERGMTPRHALLGLLHDAHEAYLQDMPTPVKVALFGSTGLPTDRDELEDGFDMAILAHFGIRPPDAKEREAIHLIDEVAFVTEWRDFMPEKVPCPKHAPADKYRIKAWPWALAEEKYLTTFNRLAILAGIGPAQVNGARG